MTSYDDQVNITNQLLKTMDKMVESLKVVKSTGDDVKAIAEEVRLIKERLEIIEERVRSMDETPSKSDLLSINETLDRKLKPLHQIEVIDGTVSRLERSMYTVRSIESPTTADIIFINKTLEENLMEARKSSDRMQTIEDRLTGVENTLTTINGKFTTIQESHTSDDNTLEAMKETINQLNTMLKSTPRYGHTTHFDATMKGEKVELSSDFRTATRTKPEDKLGYAGVICNVLLKEDEVFLIRIEETIESWSDYGIAFGVITDKNEEVKGTETIVSSRNIQGIWAIYSDSESEDGKSHTWKDGNRITLNGYPLPTTRLPKGTLLGVSRRKNGDLHFYLNGVDKGVAFGDVPKDVYAFVDIINYVTKISIVS